jgi:hypothetical protein
MSLKSTSKSKPARTAKRQSRGHKKTRRTRPIMSVPDLSAILSAYGDARSLVSVAYIVVAQSNYGPEEHVLRLGVAALDAVYDQLDQADMQLERFRKKRNAGASRGAL